MNDEKSDTLSVRLCGGRTLTLKDNRLTVAKSSGARILRVDADNVTIGTRSMPYGIIGITLIALGCGLFAYMGTLGIFALLMADIGIPAGMFLIGCGIWSLTRIGSKMLLITPDGASKPTVFQIPEGEMPILQQIIDAIDQQA